jgi:hypothetical protein
MPATPFLHLRFNASDHLPLMGVNSDDEWLALTTKGVGKVQLGPHSRLLAIDMFHQARILNSGVLAYCG